MTKFTTYRDTFPNARLTRSESGVLEVTLHTDGGTLIFNGRTHQPRGLRLLQPPKVTTRSIARAKKSS